MGLKNLQFLLFRLQTATFWKLGKEHLQRLTEIVDVSHSPLHDVGKSVYFGFVSYSFNTLEISGMSSLVFPVFCWQTS